MRIISGSRKGRKLVSFEGDSIRPTTDRVKESIFNLIQNFLPGAAVLDMFGGSGALSLEALSRGASFATIVDADKNSIKVIEKNIELTSFAEETKVLCRRAEDFAETVSGKFDIIFLDPPYNKGFVIPILNTISRRGMLSENGIAVLESDYRDEHGEIDGFEILKQRKYGRTYITVYGVCSEKAEAK